ncbi:MAG: methyltransferase [Deltaproteobacteria bacterium]|nr:methyltransferase [Deltaproteobacteria bacterium]
MFSLESFHRQYETDTADLMIRDRRFRFFVPKSLDGFVDQGDVFKDFPLWAKIWEASIVLADHLAAMPVDPERRFLEIGCGVGVVGIVAAAFGHRITITEYNSDALDFARANVHANLSGEDAAAIEVARLDWTRPQLDGRFDFVVGSEVIYKETDFQAILKLFETCLRPSGEIILAEGVRKTSLEFFRQVSHRFHITARKRTLRSKGKEVRVILAEMRFRRGLSGGGAVASPPGP